MERELQVLQSFENLATKGGAAPSGAQDCTLWTLAYMSGQSYADVAGQYAVLLMRENSSLTIEQAAQMAISQSVSLSQGAQLFGDVMNCNTIDLDVYNSSNPATEAKLSDVISGDSASTMLLITGTTGYHAVSYSSYKSGTFTYWDEQNNCSGTATISQILATLRSDD
jgi:hypothetical protein